MFKDELVSAVQRAELIEMPRAAGAPARKRGIGCLPFALAAAVIAAIVYLVFLMYR